MTFGRPPARPETMDAHPTDAAQPLQPGAALSPARAASRGRDPRAGGSSPATGWSPKSLLSERFAVSRITVRQAIEELVRKQIVVRKQGKGTFVTQPTVKHDLERLHGLLGSLFSQAEAASAKLLRYELATPPRDIAELLRPAPGAAGAARSTGSI